MNLKEIKNIKTKNLIKERCGSNIIADGLQCPYCGCFETYKDGDNPEDTTKWAFLIKAFRVDNYSHCVNCDQWF